MKTMFAVLLLLGSLTLQAQKSTFTYHANGQVHKAFTYTDAQNYSVKTYNEMGVLLESGSVVNGQLDGTWVNFHSNGKVAGEAKYLAGQKTGTWRVYDAQGLETYRITYDQNRMLAATQLDEKGHSVAESIAH